ncbi:MAG: YggS family pyridoxal phosphate-dependent enzyme [Gammaproteobacteria bacterium]|nr:YggS family pyridoxal phosphate-dependent enzyme [Gammaproteobacteria bacterium]
MTDLESSDNLIQRYLGVQQEVNTLAQAHNRQVKLLAVSKKHTCKSIEAVFAQGQRAFGENYVQEGTDKVNALSHLDIEWHFIGPIQSNKSRSVAEHFAWVHTIDREKIAQRLNDQRPESLPPLNVLIQVNISDQDSKSGVDLTQVDALANTIAQLPHLSLRGLMCIPAPQDDAQLKKEFLAMHQAYKNLQASHPSVDTLSMGMSGDLSLAIECGSNLVRIGTAIFGQRT